MLIVYPFHWYLQMCVKYAYYSYQVVCVHAARCTKTRFKNAI